MTEQLDVDRTIALLKDLCDPRGHALLDAIGEALTETMAALDRLPDVIDAATNEYAVAINRAISGCEGEITGEQLEKLGAAIEHLNLPPDYTWSREEYDDNTQHSRRAGLRPVQ
jgi:hypothetical protein